MVHSRSSQGAGGSPPRCLSGATRRAPRVAVGERAVGDRHAVAMIREPHGGALVLRVERNPAAEFETAGRGWIAHENERDRDAVLRILHFGADHIRIRSRQPLAVTLYVAAGIEKRAKR